MQYLGLHGEELHHQLSVSELEVPVQLQIQQSVEKKAFFCKLYVKVRDVVNNEHYFGPSIKERYVILCFKLNKRQRYF